jgi:hypothetical protein
VPEWLAIVIAIAAPLGSLLGVFWSRGRSEARIVGRIDLVDARIEAMDKAIQTKFGQIDKNLDEAKRSRIQLREQSGQVKQRLGNLETACSMRHGGGQAGEVPG